MNINRRNFLKLGAMAGGAGLLASYSIFIEHSIAAIRGIHSSPAYSASKAYISNYLEAIRKKAKKQKTRILVTEIMPGFVDTEMAKGEGLFWVPQLRKRLIKLCEAIDNKKVIAYVTKDGD